MSRGANGWKKGLRDLVVILLGNALYALAAAAFILPNSLITGGSTGLALIARRLWGIPVEGFVAIFNPLMFLLGLLMLGKRFALTTLVSSFWYPVIFGLFQRIPGIAFPLQDRLLAVAFAGGMIGVGIGVVIRAGASTGWCSKRKRGYRYRCPSTPLILPSFWGRWPSPRGRTCFTAFCCC